MNTVINKEHFYSISLLRMVAMLSIVSCHIFQYYGNFLAWWFNVGVQIFLCISGYLYGQKDIGEITAFYVLCGIALTYLFMKRHMLLTEMNCGGNTQGKVVVKAQLT